MSFYSTFVNATTFTGGTYFGDGRYLIGMITGATYTQTTGIVQFLRGDLVPLSATIGGAVGTTFQTFDTYSANTDFVSLTGVNPTNTVSLTATSRTVRGELVAVMTGATGRYGSDSTVPVVEIDAKGRITALSFERVVQSAPAEFFGSYRPGYWMQLPRPFASSVSGGNVGSLGTICFPFHLNKPYRLIEMAVFATMNATTSWGKFAIYSNFDFRPYELLVDYGTFLANGITSQQMRSIVGDFVLSAGTYFACRQLGGSSNAACSNAAMIQLMHQSSVPSASNIQTPACGWLASMGVSSSGSTWPQQAHTVTLSTIGSSNVPWIGIRLTGVT